MTRPPTVRPEDAARAHRVLQAAWMIVSAHHDDAVAGDVRRLGERLKAAMDSHDWATAALVIADVRSWMSTMAGVVTARMTHVFDSP